jgi:hypothetical protein
MPRKPTATDAQLVLQLYDLRREAELRKARNWWVVTFPAGAGPRIGWRELAATQRPAPVSPGLFSNVEKVIMSTKAGRERLKTITARVESRRKAMSETAKAS